MSIADKLTIIAENEQKVYDNGYTTGRNTMISRKLTSIDDDKLTSLGNYAFAGMGITSINLPNVTNAGKYSFKGCTGLTEIDLPKLTTIRGNADNTFAYCEKVTRYNLPKLKTDSTQSTYAELVRTFEGNSALERLELKNDITISKLCFYKCSKLKTLVLGADARLTSTDAFNNTPIKSGTGYIYVPYDMVDTYQNATNWRLFASQIKGYIIFYVDGKEYFTTRTNWYDFINSEDNDGTFGTKSFDVTVNDKWLCWNMGHRVTNSTDIIPNWQYYSGNHV